MIPLYLLSFTDNRVATLDDPAVDTDLGGTIQPSVTSVAIEAGAWSGLRRFIQELHLTGTVTIGVTPIVDGSEGPMHTAAFSVAEQGGHIPAFFALGLHGTRHQVRLTVLAHTGAVELGEWRRHLVPRRVERGNGQ